ncbi:hypothetical protein ACFWC5_13945 [Streptomyces sp. NPDC060085]|uniref:hypothetical protein n=1 Tax=Streptomyces sp. NPDC060085 TaxID=3347054 RepID=UPI0036606460
MAPLSLLAKLQGPHDPSGNGIYESPMDPFALAFSPGWELVLVVDTALSMQPWFSTANAIAACAHDLPLFHSVRVIRMRNRQGRPLTFAPDASSLSRAPHGALRRCMILVLTDGVGPHWQRSEVFALLRAWADHHVVAILQTLPEIEWGLTSLVARPARLRAPTPGCTNRDLAFHASEDAEVRADDDTMSESRFIPVLELRKRWIDQWVRMLLTNSRVHQPVISIPEGNLPDRPFVPKQGEQARSASERVAAFESSVPESTYALTKTLAMAPLNRYVMDLIADKSRPVATPSDLSRVLTSNLLVAYEEPAGEEGRFGEVTFDFTDDVRQCILAQSDSVHTYQTAELLETHLARHMPTLAGLVDRLRNPTPDRIPAVTSKSTPYLRVEASLLTALSTQSQEHRATAERLRSDLCMQSPSIGVLTPSETDNY